MNVPHSDALVFFGTPCDLVIAIRTIVVMRTGLNYFLIRDMKEERVNGAYGTGHA